MAAPPVQPGQAATVLQVQQGAVEGQGHVACGAAAFLQHLAGLAEVAVGHGQRPAQPGGVDQRAGLTAGGRAGSEGGKDCFRLVQLSGTDQRPDLRRAPPRRSRAAVPIGLRHGQR